MRPLALLLCLIFAMPMIAAKADVEANRQQLNQLIAQYWEHNLKQNPVFASIIGDKRYNDQLGSTSEKVPEEAGEGPRISGKRFEAIDTTGFPQQEKLNQELEIRSIKRGIHATS